MRSALSVGAHTTDRISGNDQTGVAAAPPGTAPLTDRAYFFARQPNAPSSRTTSSTSMNFHFALPADSDKRITP